MVDFENELDEALDRINYIVLEEIKRILEEKESLRQALAGVLLISDNYTENVNERLSRISARCRRELFPEKFSSDK